MRIFNGKTQVRMNTKILITGAGGFIGGFIVEEALARGYEVWAGIRKTTSKEYLQDQRIRFIDLNFADRDRLKEQLLEQKRTTGGWDYIVHNLGVTKCQNPDDFDWINFSFVRNFADMLIATGTVPRQFIYMSSLSAWGAGDEKNYRPISPDDIPKPNTRYGASKLKSERYLQSLDGFPYVFMRPTGVYGPRERDYFLMMKTIKHGFDFGVGYRPQQLTFIYVKDLVRAIFTVIDKGVTRRGYFLADPKGYTSHDFRRYIADALGKRIVIPVVVPVFVLRAVSVVAESLAKARGKASTLNRDKYHIMKQRNWLCDTEASRRELDFETAYSLEQGVHECVEWYRKNGWL